VRAHTDLKKARWVSYLRDKPLAFSDPYEGLPSEPDAGSLFDMEAS
jgi:hypothetical protein